MRPRGGVVVLLFMVGVSLYALVGMYSRIQKEDWRGVAAYLARQGSASDLVLLMDEDCRVPLDYYDHSRLPRIEVSRFADQARLGHVVQELVRREPPNGSGARIHVVISHADGAALVRQLDAVPQLMRLPAPAFVGIDVLTYAWA